VRGLKPLVQFLKRLNAVLERRSSTVLLTSRNEINSKVKNNVKGSGQECPLHTGAVPARSRILDEEIYG
jgi:hypothetical protein